MSAKRTTIQETVFCQTFVTHLILLIGILTFVWLSQRLLGGIARGANFEEAAVCNSGARLGSAFNFPIGFDPEELLSGDFNGDGLLDLAISNAGTRAFGGLVSILGGNGRGEFANVYNIQLPTRASRLCSMDFNNDGRLDLATTIPGDNSGVVIALGRGDWSFVTSVIPISVRYKAGIAAADFNSDGKADIAISGEGKLIVLNGNGNGGFGRDASYDAGLRPGSIVAADFSGDGKPDLIVFGEEFDRKPMLFINNGSGRFQPGVVVDVNGGGSDTTNAAGDLNGDGRADLAFVRGTDVQQRGISIIFSTGSGFGEPVQIPLGAFNIPNHLRMADLNGDGKLDLIATSNFGNRISIVLSNGNGSFSVRAAYSVGYFPVASAAADFDRDGKPDLAAINFDRTLSIIVGLGEGKFLAPLAFDKADRLFRATELADLNSDGRLDAVVAMGNQGGVLVAYGNGAGGFDSPNIYSTSRDGNDLAVADFNKDNRLDIVVVSGNIASAGNVSLLLGTATGDFMLRPEDLRTGQTPSSVIAADFNADGNPDLAIGNYGSNDVSILLGDGRGNFAAGGNFPVSAAPSAIVSADFDKDGKQDLAVTNFGGSTLSILRGNGAGGFIQSSVAVAKAPISQVVADFNRDGNMDLAVICRDESTTRNLYILIGNGDGSFRVPIKLETENFPRSLAAGDFTGDGNLDLALTEVLFLTDTGATNRISIYAGDTTGNFVRSGAIPVPESVYVTAGDLNNDQMIDLAVTTRVGISSALAICNPPSGAVVANASAASYLPIALAPDSIAAAFGANLATTTATAPSLPLPTELVGTRVNIKDSTGAVRSAPLFFVSPFQVNYLVPPDAVAGLAEVTVRNGNSQTISGVILITSTQPGLFTANSDGAGPPAGYLLRVKSSGTQVTEPLAVFDSAQGRFVPRPIDFFSDSSSQPDQIYLVLFGTGIRNRSTVEAVLAESIRVEVLYAGAQGDFAGLDQINLLLPRLSGTPLADLLVSVDGKLSNRVRLVFKQ